MILCYFGFYLIQWLVLFGGAYILSLYADCGSFAKILLILIGGSTFLGFLLTPLISGGEVTVSISNSICMTKKGFRYVIFGIILLINSIWSFVYYLNANTIELIFICTFIYGIELIVIGRRNNN